MAKLLPLYMYTAQLRLMKDVQIFFTDNLLLENIDEKEYIFVDVVFGIGPFTCDPLPVFHKKMKGLWSLAVIVGTNQELLTYNCHKLKTQLQCNIWTSIKYVPKLQTPLGCYPDL